LNIALVAFGVYLLVRSIKKMRHYDHLIQRIKQKHSIIEEFID
jgi:hypothetical protein